MSTFKSKEEVVAALAAKKITVEDAMVQLNQFEAIAVSAAKAGAGKAFKITADSAKGVFTITLPGMGMAIAPPAEAVEAIVANVEALKEALAKHGAERKATRAAYKQSDEYKASAAKMFDAAKAAKARRAA